MVKKFFSSKRRLVALLLWGVVGGFAWILWLQTRPLSFDKTRWHESSPKAFACSRYRMSKSLLKILQSPENSSYANVLALLGPPDNQNTNEPPVLNAPNPRYVTYRVGKKHILALPVRFYLFATFDEHGTLNQASVVPE